MNIGICDDEIVFTFMLRDIIAPLCDKNLGNYKISLYTSGEEVLEEKDRIDILFLDIEMPSIDGITVGKRYMNKNPLCKIILVTGREDRFKEGYKINALRFVTKPIDNIEVIEAFETAIHSNLGYKKMEVFRDRERFYISQKDIYYLEFLSGDINIYTGKFSFRSDKTLNQVEEELDKRLFYRINRKEIVNLSKIIYDSSNNIIGIGNKSFKVSRRRFSEFKQRYFQFDIKYGGFRI